MSDSACDSLGRGSYRGTLEEVWRRAVRNPIAGRGQDDNRAVAAGYAVAGALGAIWRELESAFPPIQPSKPPSVELLTFRDVVQYFTDNHPGDPRIKSGKVLSSLIQKAFSSFRSSWIGKTRYVWIPMGIPTAGPWWPKNSTMSWRSGLTVLISSYSDRCSS